MKTLRFTFILSVVVFDLLLLAGCTANWVSEAQSIVTVLTGAAVNILALVAALSGKTISVDDVNLLNKTVKEVQSGLNLIGQLLTEYQSNPQTTILDSLNVAISDVLSHLSSILPAMHITDTATVEKVTAVIVIVVAEVQSLEALIPVIKSGNVKMLREAAKNTNLLGPGEFADAFNKCMAYSTTSPEVNAAAGSLTQLQ